MNGCECGFDHGALGLEELPGRIRFGVTAIAAQLIAEPDKAVLRPSPRRWSMLEYGAHVRDVLLTIRDRLVIGLVEDNPGFKSLWRDKRVDLGLYRTDTPAEIVKELEAASAMYLRLFAEIEPTALEREVQYGFPDPTTRTLMWMGQQAVHEVEHHLGDIHENLVLLDG